MSAATSTVARGTNRPDFGFELLPTPRPVLMDSTVDLRKRQDGWGDICGYVSGDPASP